MLTFFSSSWVTEAATTVWAARVEVTKQRKSKTVVLQVMFHCLYLVVTLLVSLPKLILGNSEAGKEVSAKKQTFAFFVLSGITFIAKT